MFVEKFPKLEIFDHLTSFGVLNFCRILKFVQKIHVKFEILIFCQISKFLTNFAFLSNIEILSNLAIFVKF